MEAQPEVRSDLKPHAPRIETMTIGKEFIGAVIGPGGKIIQGIQEKTGAVIAIEEEDGVGKIEISGTNKATIDAAIRAIKAIVAVPEIGEIYEGKISSIMPYGAFVEFMPGKDGLLHISEIDWKRLETVEQAGLKEGDTISVKLVDIDAKTGKFKLSHKVLLPKPEGYEERPPRSRTWSETGTWRSWSPSGSWRPWSSPRTPGLRIGKTPTCIISQQLPPHILRDGSYFLYATFLLSFTSLSLCHIFQTFPG